jgi:hypothetical protein
MIKEKIPMDIKSKMGTLHQIELAEGSKQAKVFEKKLGQGLYLHIGLRKLAFIDNFKPKLSNEDMSQVLSLPEF